MIQTVVKVKDDKAKVAKNSAPRWRAFIDGLRKDLSDGSLRVRGGSNECEDFCENHDGVDVCGESVVICNDGHSGVIT